MTKINLLPDELLAITGTKKIAADMKTVVVGVFSVFLLGVFGAIAYIVVLNTQLKNLTLVQEQLKTSTKSLETAEQQIVLVKDRLQKVSQVLGDTKTEGAVNNFNNNILSFLPPEARVTEAKVSDETTSVSFVITSSSALTQLFRSMTSSEDYSKVRLESLSFSPSVGYLVTVELFEKEK